MNNLPPSIPQSFRPPVINNTGPSNISSQTNYAVSGLESNEAYRVATRARSTRQATQLIINTRSSFKKYLQQQGLNLITSSVEFRKTGDFIMSSYVVYVNHDNHRENLMEFLKRYPALQEPVIQIRNNLKNSQKLM